VTIALDHPFPMPPVEAAVTEVAPGVLWVRQPLPFALDHINLWLVAGDHGWTLVDTGIGSARSRAMWDAIFADALNGAGLERVIVTHFHPDHMGLAAWMVERFGVELWMTQAEWLFARLLHQDRTAEFARTHADFYARCGLDDEGRAALAERGNAYPKGVPSVPARYRRIRHGDVIRIGTHDWRVIGGGGHSPEHASLYCDDLKVLISGDQVLPRISPNVSVWPAEPEADPLSDFLAALDRLRGLPPDTLVLPSHGLPFRGLEARLDDLAAHHADRLAETLAACRDRPRNAAEITRLLFPRRLDAHQLSFAVGEALAHINHLVRRGDLRADESDGILVYSAR